MIKIRTIISAPLVRVLNDGQSFLRKAGHFLLLSCLFFTVSVSAIKQVTLRALSHDGQELEQAQVGQTFILEVAVTGAGYSVSDPDIHVDGCVLHRTGYQMNMINDEAIVKYMYQARIDTIGSHTIGPAVTSVGGISAQSAPLRIKVGKELVLRDNDAQLENDKELFLHLSSNGQRVVVGQQAEGTLTFYYAIPVINIQELTDPSVEGFVCKNRTTPEQGIESINGKQYQYMTWHWQLPTNKPGDLVVPSCTAEVAVQPIRDSFNRYSALFFMGAELKRLHSNSLTLHIDPLPPYNGVVDAVGQFQHFTAHLNQVTAREGDGIVLTLAIEGATDLDKLNIALQEVPHVFKSYSSKQHVENKKSGSQMAKKTFEFIMQGMEPGTWEIPAQKFTFYDIKLHKYTTLKTKPLTIKIVAQMQTKKYVPPSLDDLLLATAIDAEGDNDDFVLDTHGNWRAVSERTMPWWLFMSLFFAPLGLWISRFLRRLLRRYGRWRAPRSRWRSAFKVARKQLQHAESTQDFSALYRLFVDLFVIRCSIKQTLVSEQMTTQVLRVGGLSSEQTQEWKEFFADISSFVFYNATTSDAEKKLFDQANKWLTILEDML